MSKLRNFLESKRVARKSEYFSKANYLWGKGQAEFWKLIGPNFLSFIGQGSQKMDFAWRIRQTRRARAEDLVARDQLTSSRVRTIRAKSTRTRKCWSSDVP